MDTLRNPRNGLVAMAADVSQSLFETIFRYDSKTSANLSRARCSITRAPISVAWISSIPNLRP